VFEKAPDRKVKAMEFTVSGISNFLYREYTTGGGGIYGFHEGTWN